MTQPSAEQELVTYLRSQYLDVRVLPDGSVAALYDLMFTRAIMLGCTREGYAARFCFEDRELAKQRFSELLTEDDIPAGYVASRQ